MSRITRSIVFISSISIILFTSACKKSQPAAATISADKSITLNNINTSLKDTLFVTRSVSTVILRVSANTMPAGTQMKRLYIFTRTLDNPASPGSYTSLSFSGFSTDGNNNYFYQIPDGQNDSISNYFTVTLRANTINAIADEFYFVYTDNNDYAGPGNATGVVIGPAQFIVEYGKLSEYTGNKIYNYATLNTNYYPAFDIVDDLYKYDTDAPADIDIDENTDNSPLFLGKFKSRNGTTFVKASSGFSYGNATDTQVAYYYSLGTPFTETPDSIRIGDIYLMQLRGGNTYAAMKILYITPENGKTGGVNNNEYFIFNFKK